MPYKKLESKDDVEKSNLKIKMIWKKNLKICNTEKYHPSRGLQLQFRICIFSHLLLCDLLLITLLLELFLCLRRIKCRLMHVCANKIRGKFELVCFFIFYIGQYLFIRLRILILVCLGLSMFVCYNKPK